MSRRHQFSLGQLLIWVTLICCALAAVIAFFRGIEIGQAAARRYGEAAKSKSK